MRRIVSLVAIFISILALSFVLCLLGDLYPDEWICIAYIDIIFYMLFLFELEYERSKYLISNNSRTDYVKFAIAFFICCMICVVSGILPVYCRPVAFTAILLCLAANEYLGFICGTFFCILLGATVSGDFYDMICEILLVITSSILAKMLREDKLQIYIYVLAICLNVVTPNIFYYMSNKEFSSQILINGTVTGILAAIFCFLCSRIFRPHSADEINDRLITIISDDFSEVTELKEQSFSEYNHANFVSTLAIKAAKVAGLNTALCAAGGFYYRIGRWQDKPGVKAGTDRAEVLNFPEPLITLLGEYYGELAKPSTPESALVHMIDALIVKLDHLKIDVADNDWNHDILVIQTLNEFSTSGLYDKSGLSMNHFLKIRDYLTKEELLR